MNRSNRSSTARYLVGDGAVPTLEVGIWLAIAAVPMIAAVFFAVLAVEPWQQTGTVGVAGWAASALAAASHLAVGIINVVVLRRCRVDPAVSTRRLLVMSPIVMAAWCTIYVIQIPASTGKPLNPAGLAIVWCVAAALVLGAAALARNADTIGNRDS